METKIKNPKDVYVNGLDVERTDYSTAKQVLAKMPSMRGKLSGYGPLTKKRQSNLDSTGYKEVDRFVKNGFQFVVFKGEAMFYSLGSMTMSEPQIVTEVFWQKIK